MTEKSSSHFTFTLYPARNTTMLLHVLMICKKILAQSALDYIAQHYSEEDLSISGVASSLNISVPYLGVLLRQETGRNYLTTILGRESPRF